MDLNEYGKTKQEKIVALILALQELDLGTFLATKLQELDGMFLIHFICSFCDFIAVNSWPPLG